MFRYRLMNREAEITYFVDKYVNDIEEFKIKDKQFDKKIMEKNNKINEWNRILERKNKENDDKKSKIKDMEIQKLVLQYNREEQEKVIEPLRNTLENMKTTVQEVSTWSVHLDELEIKIVISYNLIKNKCVCCNVNTQNRSVSEYTSYTC